MSQPTGAACAAAMGGHHRGMPRLAKRIPDTTTVSIVLPNALHRDVTRTAKRLKMRVQGMSVWAFGLLSGWVLGQHDSSELSAQLERYCQQRGMTTRDAVLGFIRAGLASAERNAKEANHETATADAKADAIRELSDAVAAHMVAELRYAHAAAGLQNDANPTNLGAALLKLFKPIELVTMTVAELQREMPRRAKEAVNQAQP